MHGTLNLGILAHVDAGKTTLTERLLYAAGVIDEIGRVDDGTTQTDSLALERQRGITIKSAVVSFAIDDVTVNLIDTPGHPDFIAEVERVLSVLDGAVLLVSAVEGVQAQTRVLMRTLQRLHIPTLIFVNKIDRPGASDERVLQTISERLTPAIIPVGSAHRLGTRAADFTLWGAADAALRARLTEVLAERDDGILAAYVDDEAGVSSCRLRQALAAQTKRAHVHPVFFGSAITGAGVELLMAGIAELLPAAEGDAEGPVSGTVFKIERGPAGEKIAYVRMFSGTVRTRDRLRFGRDVEDKVTAISVFDRGSAVQRASVSAGEIGKLWGLGEIQIGDTIGQMRTTATHHQFAPPALETVVVPRSSTDKGRLRVALAQLAEQDPLIDVRQDDARQEISVSLYGEVQKEVIQATLASDFGIDVTFRETTMIYIERPAGTGAAVEVLHAESNPFLATVGLRIDPAPIDSGIDFRLQVDHRTVPMYVYKRVENFTENMGQYVRQTLQEGLFGWQVTDCIVTMTKCNYSSPDGPPATRGPLSTAADFRNLTPLVLMRALERAGTKVCEPIVRVRLEIPTDAVSGVLSVLARLGAMRPPSLQGELSTIETVLPAARVQDVQRRLPALTGGEGVLESDLGGYQPVSGAAPTRRRTTANPLNSEEYLMHLARRVQQRSN
ncbi:MAG: TetM/TetW/TetO/TetS family tetracycline resistance ribosomal protection protein [Actinobacteria bacterium]|nr:TetM/TetW/TetO/TetS family tetracycline resistance ribosomal protection protein [Actinomycetota bacterium]